MVALNLSQKKLKRRPDRTSTGHISSDEDLEALTMEPLGNKDEVDPKRDFVTPKPRLNNYLVFVLGSILGIGLMYAQTQGLITELFELVMQAVSSA